MRQEIPVEVCLPEAEREREELARRLALVHAEAAAWRPEGERREEAGELGE